MENYIFKKGDRVNIIAWGGYSRFAGEKGTVIKMDGEGYVRVTVDNGLHKDYGFKSKRLVLINGSISFTIKL